MNDPPPRGGIENPKDFQGVLLQKTENRKSEIRKIRNGGEGVKKYPFPREVFFYPFLKV